MITVRAIGAGEVQIGRKRITKRTEMELAVAVYLCVRAGERLTRDEVIDVFWPGADPAKGRHSLRQMLYKLRLRGFTLDEEAEFLHLDRARVDCDVSRALEDSWPETAEPWMIEDSSEFLPVVTRAISPQFQEWLDSTRSRLGAQYRLAALRQLAQARREGRWADMERWSRVVLRTDPLNEEATMARAESAAMAGSKAMALEILDQYVEDLGERAGQIALPATVLRRRISERRPEWGGRGAREVPLVGREDLMRRLTMSLESAGQGRGTAILLYGAPGIGKTRLASELREFALISGFSVSTVRATHSDAARPLALAIAIASALQNLPGVAGTSPAALALISRLCRPSTQPQTDSPAGSENISPTDTAWALADAFAAATHEKRILLSIDDLHNADEMSLQVLSTLAHTSREHRLLLIATSRLPARHTPHPSATHPLGFLPVAVRPLSFDDASLLVSHFAASPSRQRPATTDAAIARAGGGNPLFLRELTSQRASRDAPDRLPESLIEVIEQRIARFSKQELRLLRLVSLLGSLARFSRIRALIRPDAWDADSFLEQLELEGVLTVSSSGALELHECWNESVRDALKGTALCAMSLDIAVLLASESSTDAGFSNYWRAAELFAVAGNDERSREQFCHVARLFMGRGLARQSAEALRQAAALKGDLHGRAELLAQLAVAQNSASLHHEAVTSCEEALSCRTDPISASPSFRAEVLSTLTDSQFALGRPIGEALAALASAASRRDIPDSVCQRACHIGLRSLLNSGGSDLATTFLNASSVSTASSGKSLMGSIVRLMYAAEFGAPGELASMEREVAEACDEKDTLTARLLALRYRATALRSLGFPQPAAELLEVAFGTAIASGAPRDARIAASCLAFLHLDQANLVEANRWLLEISALTTQAEGIDLDRTYTHAKARYLLELGDAKGAIETYAPHMSTLKADTALRRRAVDSACLSLALALTGDHTAAREFCGDAMKLLDAVVPGPHEDWVANTVIRTLSELGAHANALSVNESYLTRRASTQGLPIPSGFHELTADSLARRRNPAA